MRVIRASRSATVNEITEVMKEVTKGSVCSRTVRRVMKKLGYDCRVAVKKPLLTRQHMYVRYRWCLERRLWKDEWKRIFFSDESMIRQYPDGRVRIWRLSHEKYDMDCVVPRVQGGGISIMVWGMFSFDGVGPLEFVEGSMDSRQYIGVLDTHVLGYLAYNPTYTFQQDNASCHKSKMTKSWMQENNMPVLEWPARSPDLSPIENLWHIVKAKIRSSGRTAKTKQELFQLFHAAWLEIPVEECYELIDSMPRRMEACIAARGGPTKY